MKWLQRSFSSRCCGGPVLALMLLCTGFGVLFLCLSASLPGLVFISAGVLAEVLCLILGLSRCEQRYRPRRQTG